MRTLSPVCPLETRDVPARPRQAGDVPEADRVGMSSEHYWDRIGHLSSYLNLSRRRRKNEVDIHTGEIGRQFPQLLCCFRPAKLDHNVFSLGVSEVAQPPTQRLYPIRPGRRGPKAQESNSEASRRLLRARRQRPRRRTAERG